MNELVLSNDGLILTIENRIGIMPVANATFITTNPTGNGLGLNPRLRSER